MQKVTSSRSEWTAWRLMKCRWAAALAPLSFGSQHLHFATLCLHSALSPLLPTVVQGYEATETIFKARLSVLCMFSDLFLCCSIQCACFHPQRLAPSTSFTPLATSNWLTVVCPQLYGPRLSSCQSYLLSLQMFNLNQHDFYSLNPGTSEAGLLSPSLSLSQPVFFLSIFAGGVGFTQKHFLSLLSAKSLAFEPSIFLREPQIIAL